MESGKPITYPNLVESITTVALGHVGIHDAIAQHAATHAAKLEAKRKALEIKHAASKLMEDK